MVWSEVQMTCTVAHGPADGPATRSTPLQLNPEWFLLLAPAYPGWKMANERVLWLQLCKEWPQITNDQSSSMVT